MREEDAIAALASDLPIKNASAWKNPARTHCCIGVLVANQPINDATDDGENQGSESSCPEAADIHARYDKGCNLEQEAVDNKSKQTECDNIDWQGENGDNWFDDGVDNGEDNGAEHQSSEGVKVETLYELGGEIQPEAVT